MDRNLLYLSIEKSTAHRLSRDYNAGLVAKSPELLTDLLVMATDTAGSSHHKACWILELVLEKNIDWLCHYPNVLFEKLPFFVHDGAVRSVSKICMFAVMHHLRELPSGTILLSEKQLKVIVETCFDWLIGDTKVASKVYAMRVLFEIGKLQPWIYPELSGILELGFSVHSAAYRTAAKELLKKME